MTGAEADRAPVATSQDPLQSPSSSKRAAVLEKTPASDSAPLSTLAREGAWKTVAERATGEQAGTAAWLAEAAWRVLALSKLRNFAAAAEELSGLGDLDGPAYSVETPNGTQSLVPFALRILACELPARAGNWKASQDAFYKLLEHCRLRLSAGLRNADAELEAKYKALWRQREERVAANLFSQHLRLREYRVALEWLAWLRGRYPDSLALMSTLGRTQLVIGHTRAAADSFEAVEKLVGASPGLDKQAQALVRSNRGLLLFAQSDFAGAGEEFDALAAADPNDTVAANNRAVCRMYGGDLAAAIQVLEDGLQKQPEVMLDEAVLGNLSSMYDLLSPALGQACKKNVAVWAGQTAPQDFDLSCLR